MNLEIIFEFLIKLKAYWPSYILSFFDYFKTSLLYKDKIGLHEFESWNRLYFSKFAKKESVNFQKTERKY